MDSANISETIYKLYEVLILCHTSYDLMKPRLVLEQKLQKIIT